MEQTLLTGPTGSHIGVVPNFEMTEIRRIVQQEAEIFQLAPQRWRIGLLEVVGQQPVGFFLSGLHIAQAAAENRRLEQVFLLPVFDDGVIVDADPDEHGSDPADDQFEGVVFGQEGQENGAETHGDKARDAQVQENIQETLISLFEAVVQHKIRSDESAR